MSTYSEAWQTTPPAVRDFYRNYHRRNLAHCWKEHYDWTYQMWFAFTTIGWSFLGYSGYALAQVNWAHQTFLTGSFNTAIVNLTILPDWPPPDVQPVGPGLNDGAYPDQFQAIPAYAIEYPREKYKVRRQYWTGKPRRRRNL